MASPPVEVIKKVHRTVWPEVNRALDQQTQGILELAGLAEEAFADVERYVAYHHGDQKRRSICQESVWAMSRRGMLRTGQEAELVKYSRRIAQSLKEELAPDEMTPDEQKFIEIVESLPEWPEKED